MDYTPEEKLLAFLKMIGLSLQDLADTRKEILITNHMPDKLIIPAMKILGCDVEFGQVNKPRMTGK